MTRPSQPSVPTLSGSQVCQMSMDRKWERDEFSYPMPWIIAIWPWSHRFLHRTHAGMEGQVIRELDQLVFGQPQIGPVLPIERVGKRHYRIEIVIGAGKAARTTSTGSFLVEAMLSSCS